MNVKTLYPSKYLSAPDLNGREFTLTVREVKLEKFDRNGDQIQLPVVYFEKCRKGLGLNKTNAWRIAALYGFETEAWAGKPVTIFPTTCDAWGSRVDCVRVREEPTPITASDGEVVADSSPAIEAEPNAVAEAGGITEDAIPF